MKGKIQNQTKTLQNELTSYLTKSLIEPPLGNSKETPQQALHDNFFTTLFLTSSHLIYFPFFPFGIYLHLLAIYSNKIFLKFEWWAYNHWMQNNTLKSILRAQHMS